MSDAITRSVDHLRPWMPWIAYEPATLQDRIALIRQWRSEWEEGGDSTLGIFHDGAVVGGTGLHRRGDPHTLEIGYWIHVDHLRRGFATEAARALTEVALEIPEIDEVRIRHDKANRASAKIPRTLGYSLAGEHEVKKEAPAWSGILVVWAKGRT